MNLLVLSAFAIVCSAAVESRYPYDDTYATGDIVPHGLNSRYAYDRDRGRYPGRPIGVGKNFERDSLGGGGYYGGAYNGRDRIYGRNRNVQNRDYRRRSRDYDSHLPPRGIGGYNKHQERPDYEYGRSRRPHISGPPKYYDDEEINYGGYKKKIRGSRIGYN